MNSAAILVAAETAALTAKYKIGEVFAFLPFERRPTGSLEACI